MKFVDFERRSFPASFEALRKYHDTKNNKDFMRFFRGEYQSYLNIVINSEDSEEDALKELKNLWAED